MGGFEASRTCLRSGCVCTDRLFCWGSYDGLTAELPKDWVAVPIFVGTGSAEVQAHIASTGQGSTKPLCTINGKYHPGTPMLSHELSYETFEMVSTQYWTCCDPSVKYSTGWNCPGCQPQGENVAPAGCSRYFWDTLSFESSWQHPVDAQLKQLYENHKSSETGLFWDLLSGSGVCDGCRCMLVCGH